MKKIISFLLMLFISLSVFSGCAKDNSSKDTSGSLKETPTSDFEYEISQNGDFVYIKKYIGTSDIVVIPNQIENKNVSSLTGKVNEKTGSLEGVFENSNIKEVVLPASLAAIGNNAFKNCKQLSKIEIPSNSKLKVISAKAFQDCTSIKSIDLSSTSLTTIDTSAFEGCLSMSKITLSESLEEIGKRAFYQCSSLTEIQLPQSLTAIKGNAFGYCSSLKSINIPKNLKMLELENPPFYKNDNLEKIIFDDGRNVIEGYAFFNLNSNVHIVIPKSVKEFSPSPFFIYNSITFEFLGDCPTINSNEEFQGDAKDITIIYEPETIGWDECDWMNTYNAKPKTNSVKLIST